MLLKLLKATRKLFRISRVRKLFLEVLFAMFSGSRITKLAFYYSEIGVAPTLAECCRSPGRPNGELLFVRGMKDLI
jgi:hypothetical protein